MKTSLGLSAFILALFLLAAPAFAGSWGWSSYDQNNWSWNNYNNYDQNNWNWNNYDQKKTYRDCNPVPEPSAALVFAIGALVVGQGVRRSRRTR